MVCAAVAFSTVYAQQPTPGPAVPPSGEFAASPSRGPVGTLVTLAGHLDQPITWITLRCGYGSGDSRTQSGEALSRQDLPEPASDFSFVFEIPAELGVRQPRSGEPATVSADTTTVCKFEAVAWHQLLYKSTPFTVTADGLPPTGTGPVGHSSFGAASLTLALGGTLFAGLGVALRRASRPT